MSDWVTNAWSRKYTSLYIWHHFPSPAAISCLKGLDAMEPQIFSYCIITTQQSVMAAMMIMMISVMIKSGTVKIVNK